MANQLLALVLGSRAAPNCSRANAEEAVDRIEDRVVAGQRQAGRDRDCSDPTVRFMALCPEPVSLPGTPRAELNIGVDDRIDWRNDTAAIDQLIENASAA